MLFVTVFLVSILNVIIIMEIMFLFVRGGLVFVIKLKFRFWLIIGEECDSEGNVYLLIYVNGCYN